MGMIFMTGAESGSKAEFSGYGGGMNDVVTSPVRTGTYAMKYHNNQGAVTALFTAISEGYIQFAINFGGRINYTFFSIRNGSNDLYALSWKSDGSDSVLQLRSGSYSGTVVAEGTKVLTSGTWYVIEIHYKLADTGGVFEMRIDGVPDITITGDTKPGSDTTFDGLRWEIIGSSLQINYIDDVIVNDTSGSMNNSWPNGTNIAMITPNADDGTNEWAVSGAASHYGAINEIPPATAQYLKAASINLTEKFGLSNLPAEAATIQAVKVSILAKKGMIGVAPEKIAPILSLDGTDYQQSDLSPGTSEANVRAIYDLAPDSTIWTPTKVNDLKLGFKSRT